MTTVGIVLAGGRSSRFPPDKLASTYRGLPLLHHPILRLAEVCEQVLVVVSPDGTAPALPPGIPARVIRDSVAGQGPLAGLAAALTEVDGGWVLVAGGDMPDLSTAVLIEMLRTARSAPADAVALQEGTGPSPLPVALKADEALRATHALLHRGDRRLGSVLDALRTAVIDEATWTAFDPTRATLRDIDTPGDLDD